MSTLRDAERAYANAKRIGEAGNPEALRDSYSLLAIINAELRRRAADPSIELLDQLDIQEGGRGADLPGQGTYQEREPLTFQEKLIGLGEAALATATGATIGTGGLIGGTLKGIADEIIAGEFGGRAAEETALRAAEALTYSPRTRAGQKYMETVGRVLEPIPAVVPLAGELSALIATPGVTGAARRAVTQAAKRPDLEPQLDPSAQGPPRMEPPPQPDSRAPTQVGIPLEDPRMIPAGSPVGAGQIDLRGQAQATQQGMPQPDRGTIAPQQPLPPSGLVADPNGPITRGTGRSVGAGAVDVGDVRQSQAGDLPVPVKLTEGQRTQDFEQQRFERETAKLPKEGVRIRDRFEQQNEQLQQNLDAFIDRTGAQVSDLIDVGDIVDKALRARLKRSRTEVKSKYARAARIGAMADEVTLPKLAKHLIDSEPSEGLAKILRAVRLEAKRLKLITPDSAGVLIPHEAPLTKIEKLRKFINANTDFDANNIRQSKIMKNLIDEETAKAGGQAYKDARAARVKLAKDYENVGLMKQLLGTKSGTNDRAIALEDVLNKSILQPSTPLATVKQLKRLLHTTPGKIGKQAWRELQGGVLRHIRDRALKNVQTDQLGNRIISPAQLSRVLEQLDRGGKLDFIFGKEGAEQLRVVNDVAQDVFNAPPGVVNTSNTASVLAGFMDVAISGSIGVPAPIVTGMRMLTSSIRNKKLKARVDRALGE